jgi:NAD(P)H-flavin reductase
VTDPCQKVSEDDILLKHELAKLENKFPQRFRVSYVLDSPPPEWKGSSGYITEELLNATMPKEGNFKIFICGCLSTLPLSPSLMFHLFPAFLWSVLMR